MNEAVLHMADQKETMGEAATLRTLNAFAVDLISIPNVDDLFWYVAQNVVGQLRFADCVIYQANPSQTELVQVAALGEKNPFGRSILNPLKIPFGQGITGQVAKTAEPIVINDLMLEKNYIEDTQPARSEICVPIICGNRVMGVIDSEHPKPNAFGSAELEVLVTIAAMTSAKLELLAEAEQSSQRYHDLVEAHSQLSRETSNRKSLEAELFKARKLEAVGRLTGRFAHEFNNLLTVISGNLEFIETVVADSPVQEPFQDAKAAAARGEELIKSMLGFSQRSHLTPQTQDIGKTITTICAPFLTEARYPVKVLPFGKCELVRLDTNVFEPVFLNLLQNARDSMPDGGVIEVSVETLDHRASDRRPTASMLLPGRYVCVSVKDRGAGISPERIEQIFDPFYTTKPIGCGTGLGLSMTLGFMLQSGGSVAVHSGIGKGSIFQLYFPTVS